MGKILSSMKTLRRRSAIIAAGLVMAVASLVVGPATQASAAGCNYFTEPFIGTMNDYSYTWMHWVPSTSGCRDINIQNVWNQNGSNNACIQLRVRFYPSTGGSIENSWKQFCGGWGSLVIASNVKDTTQYRVEARYGSNYVGYSVRLFD
jgi:hypothetical protein